MAGFEELNFLVIVPKGGGECREFQVTADPQDTGEKLKKRIEKLCGVPTDDMELFIKNSDVEGAKQKWLYEDATLDQQEVKDGAVITVGVHGMKGSEPIEDPETGELADDAVATSIASKGDASYYFAHARKPELPESQRIVSGGEPEKLGESATPLEEPKNARRLLEDDEDDGRPERPIRNYSWGDEKETIRIYVDKDGAPEAIKAAGDGKGNQVEVKWESRRMRLRVHDEKIDWVLDLDRIYYDIIPEECKFRVSQNKRITLTLKKKENYTWLKLLKPE